MQIWLRSTCCLLFASALQLVQQPACGQWSSDATVNLPVTQGPSEQVQPKAVPTADGGFFVSFFDNNPNGTPAFGYDVYLQRLDRQGTRLWSADGVLIADRGFSSTQDYGLATDIAGHALLAFRDSRFVGTQITATRVDPSGHQVWGPTGVQLTNTTAFVASPKVAGLSDGGIAVAWTEGNSVRIQRLAPNGQALWPQDVVLAPTTGSHTLADLQAAENGGLIVSFVRQSGGFSTPRHLVAQKLDASGNLVWGAGGVAVFDGGSLQIGNFPRFVPDGAGGAVFGWYSSTPSLECRAQRLNAAGQELFPHNGTPASTDSSKSRTQPYVAFDAAEQETFLVYIEGTLNADGISAQKYDALGQRQWTDLGVAVLPLTATDCTGAAGVELNDGLQCFWISQPTFGQATVSGLVLNDAGLPLSGSLGVGTTVSNKLRLTAHRSSLGCGLALWQDAALGNDDVRAQNLLPNGQLGGNAQGTQVNGSGVNPLIFSATKGPQIGLALTTNVAHGGKALLSQTYGYLGGLGAPLPLPGLGELLVDLGSPLLYSTSIASIGSSDAHSAPVPLNLALVGLPLRSQALYLRPDFSLQLCNALDLVVGL
jgi:hypothetical protein